MYNKAILDALDHDKDMLYDITRDFKDKGLNQFEAYEILKRIRCILIEKKDEDTEDLVLELMDYVVGFCQPKYKIWDEVIK